MDKIKDLVSSKEISGGNVIPSGIMPGPMEGVMTPLLCKTLAELDLIDFWITPFIRISTGIPKLSTIRKKISQFTENSRPVIVQLMGNDSEKLAQSALQIKKLDLLGVNMNFACPSKRVVNNEGGGSQLKSPQQMHDILSSMKEHVENFSVSAKLRIGFEDPAEMEEIIPAVCESGIDFLMLHFRTVKEGYKDVNKGMERLARAVELAKTIPVIGSGDIFTPQDAEHMYKLSGCDGITVARGLLKNPFLIREIQQYFATGEFNTTETHKILFYDTMIDIARQNPHKYWSKPNLLEIGRFLWGVNSNIFNKLKKMDRDNFFSLTSVATIK